MKKLNILLLLMIVFYSCEEQPVILPEFSVPVTDKVVLLEELTGVVCPNCPRGVAAVEAILEQFPGKVVNYGIHGNLQTTPLPESKYDFRNQDAIDLEESMKPFFGKPAARINRRHFEGEVFASTSSVDLWFDFVQQELEKDQVVNIVIEPSYDEATRRVQINIGAAAISELDGPLYLHVAIVESHLIDLQEDLNFIHEEFEHHRVLKDLLTQLSGDNLADRMDANDNITKTYSYTVPEENNGEWIPENMEIIAYVTSEAEDGIVLQAGAVYIK